ncbi:MAG: methylenetetrahydrofolate reductase [NAD(P)H] [Planctomycetota bacterium]|nr:methylenetetrahydrofolate reductase [NAD(P)H] [Planctomycetota bacterium]
MLRSHPLANRYRSGSFGLSFEIYPPKTADGDELLWQHVAPLATYRPAFISCTYGAGGSTRSRTLELCEQITRRFQVDSTAHFTCLGGTVDELREWLNWAKQHGVQNIMALRGDPPAGQATFSQVAGGLRYANELVDLIHREFPEFGIGVAGYPEKHPQAPSLEVDIANLKRKVDAGADAVYTQLFYVNDAYYRFRDSCVAAGVDVPIVPGVMPILNFAQIKRITALCGAELPASLSSRLEAAQDDKDEQFRIGVEFAIEQCVDLQRNGVPGIHFYVLNRSTACEQILQAMGLSGT